ncbi:DUF45 domain-containing protein [Patescibacteria group bacterium]|nr:DUF45 domain-containing protein [Patescibacteria group bacterium]
MIKYKIIFKKRKNISILLDKDGNIIINAPKNISKKYIDNFVQSNKKWIENNKKLYSKDLKIKQLFYILGKK